MKFVLVFLIAFYSISAATAQVVGTDGKPSIEYKNNLIKNPSAAKNTLYVTTSSAAITRETGTKVDNLASFGIQTSALNGYVRFQMFAIPDDLKSGDCVFVGWFKGDASLYNAEVLDESSNVVAYLELTNESNGRYFQLPVTCGTSRTPQIVQRRAGTAPKIFAGQLTYTSGRGLASSPILKFLGSTAGVTTVDTGTLTNAEISAKSWQNGDRLRHEVSITFTGAPGTWTILSYTLPSIFGNIDTSKMNTTTAAVQEVGQGSLVGSPNQLKVYYLSTNRVRPRILNVSGSTVIGNDITSTSVTNGTVINFTIDVPLAIWSGVFPVLTPTETYDPFGDIVAPTGTGGCKAGSVPANGAAVSRTQHPYSRYFAMVGTTYGAGDGSTTFNLPNVSGISLRYVGSQTYGGETYTATLGQKRNDAFEAHSHTDGLKHSITDASVFAYGNVAASGAGVGGYSAQSANLKQSISSNAGSGTETHGPDLAVHGCLVLVSAQAPAITGLITSPDANTSGRTEVINTVKTITSNYTLTGQDETLNINAAGATANITVSLPPAAQFPGKKYNLRITGGSYHATIDGFGTEGICGQPTIKLAGSNDGITIQSATTGWIGLEGGCNRTIYVNYSGSGTNGVCNASPCTVSNNYGGLLSVLRASAGVFQPNYSGLFSAAPTCNIQAGNNANFVLGFINGSLPTISNADLRTASNSGTYIDTFGMITCTGQR